MRSCGQSAAWLVALFLAACTSTDVPSGSAADSVVAHSPPAREPATAEPTDTLVPRMSPADFDSLPPAVTRALLDRGCTIPQACWAIPEPHNVIRGRFARPDQEDWAVLCSRDGRLTILVFWSGAASDVTELDEGEERFVLQHSGGGRFDFSKVIGIADASFIRRMHAYFPDSPEPPAVLDHDGINVLFVEKASVVLYLYEGSWLRLQGVD